MSTEKSWRAKFPYDEALLTCVRRAPGSPQWVLADRLGIARTHVQCIVTRLRRLGLIDIRMDDEHRWGYYVREATSSRTMSDVQGAEARLDLDRG
jgi:DNA-binding MarR family transcriptional regulator